MGARQLFLSALCLAHRGSSSDVTQGLATEGTAVFTGHETRASPDGRDCSVHHSCHCAQQTGITAPIVFSLCQDHHHHPHLAPVSVHNHPHLPTAPTTMAHMQPRGNHNHSQLYPVIGSLALTSPALSVSYYFVMI